MLGFMGKQRFRLSHMIPNAWFYRLRDMKTLPHNSNNLSSSNNHQKSSFCYTPKLYSSPSTINRPPAVPKHVLGSIYIRPSTESTHTNQDLFLSPGSSCYESPLFDTCGCGVVSSSTADVKFVFNDTTYTKIIHDSSQEIDHLPQIITKSERDTSTKENEQSIYKTENSRRKKLVSGSNASKAQLCKRVVPDQNKFSSGCCIVKSTFDPCKDLKESMMEMIVDYNIRASKDLEKLLAFYLSLNSNECHDMIVKAFEEIWLSFDFDV